MKSSRHTVLLCTALLSCVMLTLPCADELHSRNKKANALYEKGNYDEALKAYDNLLLEYPSEQKLKMNRGSTQYRLGDFDKAEESYNAAAEAKDKKTLADLCYNLGNALYMQGERLSAQSNQQAMEKYKAALENYIKSLDIRTSDRDAKWNAQLVQKKIKQMEQQQQQQNNKDQKKDKQQQNNKDQKQNQNQDKNKKDQNKDNQQKNKKDQQQDQKNQEKDRQNQQNKNDQDKQKPEPTPQQQKQKDMKKEEAKRLIEQFSDDDKELNKKPEKIGVYRDKKVEKDW